ncbi:MAG TPA: NPCBM/NEW2 domain-containing protein [Propionicimonas sp.]|nr:NPCBM/NEW2 domain-containing protein [Propionicimonas sp.]
MRKLLVTVMSVLLTAAMLLAAPNPAEAAKKKFKVSIAASTSSITVGDHFSISGRITPAVAGKAVTIKKKVGGGKWYGTTKVYTAADGSYTFDAAPPQLGKIYYRVYTAKKGKYKAAYSKTISVTVKQAVQQSASVTITGTGSTNITAGDSYVVKGTTSANLIGKTVVLATLDGSAWSNLTSATVAADSTFSLSAAATSAGAGRSLKVYAPATTTTLYAESATAAFNVYGWYYLSERTKLENSGWGSSDVTVNAQYYPKSLYFNFGVYDGVESVQFDLGRKCTTFSATAGWSDKAYANIVGAGAVYKDSVKVWNLSGIKFGTGTPISVDISTALRLKLEAQRASGSTTSAFVFGDAKILCAF